MYQVGGQISLIRPTLSTFINDILQVITKIYFIYMCTVTQLGSTQHSIRILCKSLSLDIYSTSRSSSSHNCKTSPTIIFPITTQVPHHYSSHYYPSSPIIILLIKTQVSPSLFFPILHKFPTSSSPITILLITTQVSPSLFFSLQHKFPRHYSSH